MRKPYQPVQPANWWLRNKFYRFYMLREATAIPLFVYMLVLIAGIFALAQGEAAFVTWVEALRSPGMLALHLLAAVALALHIFTWFALVPKILVLRAKGMELPGAILQAAHWLGAVFCTAVIVAAFIVFAGGHL